MFSDQLFHILMPCILVEFCMSYMHGSECTHCEHLTTQNTVITFHNVNLCNVLYMYVCKISIHMCAHSIFTCSKVVLLFYKTVGNDHVNSSVLLHNMNSFLLPTIF